jgi:hypothetical protein
MSWQDEPATEKQIASYNRMCDQLGVVGLIGNLTKSEIAPLIGEFKKKVKDLNLEQPEDLHKPIQTSLINTRRPNTILL